MSADAAILNPVSRTASGGAWSMAWRRLRRNRAGMLALTVVLAFLLCIAASALGWLARDWDTQVGVSFAPPSFLGATPAGTLATGTERDDPRAPVDLYGVIDPLEAEMAVLRRDTGRDVSAPTEVNGVVDPLAAELQLARQHGARAVEARRQPTLALGADKWGRSVVWKVLKGAETSVCVGFAAALLATLLGTVLGALAGYGGGWVDALVDWLYGVFTAVPYLLLVFAIAAVLQQKGVLTIVLILGLTGWTNVYRLIRAEYIKHKAREYVQAARAIAASHRRRMFIHILPNVSHVVLVQLSQQVVNFIKAEVILSFLGFGVPVDVVSWGSILNETPNELILGKWWQLATAACAMALLVTAFAMLTDALRDALDPRLK